MAFVQAGETLWLPSHSQLLWGPLCPDGTTVNHQVCVWQIKSQERGREGEHTEKLRKLRESTVPRTQGPPSGRRGGLSCRARGLLRGLPRTAAAWSPSRALRRHRGRGQVLTICGPKLHSRAGEEAWAACPQLSCPFHSSSSEPLPVTPRGCSETNTKLQD